MSAKHTPGPWYVGAQNDALYIIDRRPAQGNDYPNHEADTACIARVFDDVRGNEDSGRLNAELLAAAPELLQVLHDVCGSLALAQANSSDRVDWSRDDSLKRALEAIVKATGSAG